MSKPKLIAGVVVAVVGFILFVPYRTWSYSGPGAIHDHGLISRPRFSIALPTMKLDEAQSRSFTFSGPPSEEMSLQLYVVGGSFNDEAVLTKLRTQMSARLVDVTAPQSPIVLCSASGTPATPDRDGRWVLMTSGFEAAYWHSDCLGVTLSRKGTYTLYLEIQSPDPSSPARLLVPTIEGGGIELP